MTIYYTSDLHFGHKLVSKLRGFGDDVYATVRHDAHIVEMWHNTVRENDTVWVLGDLVCNQKDHEYSLGILAELPGKKRFIFGNHDIGHPMHSPSHKYFLDYLDVFETVGTVAHIKSDGQKILLSHFPYDGEGDREGERYSEWRQKDAGAFLIHGHTHSSTRFTTSKNGTPQMHVGLDAWDLGLVHEKYIHEWVAKNRVA